ncbi:hypothetical protein DFH07DRAFT_700842, partial [Mycena maculata]
FWSLDPLANQRLTIEDAECIGFPSVSFKMVYSGNSWNAEVYVACHQLALAKGFDPDSEDLARHLGYPLFEPSGALFEHSEQGNS